MSVRCRWCGKSIPITEVDEITPPDQEKGIEITGDIMPADKAHVWKEKNGNLYIHYPRVSGRD